MLKLLIIAKLGFNTPQLGEDRCEVAVFYFDLKNSIKYVKNLKFQIIAPPKSVIISTLSIKKYTKLYIAGLCKNLIRNY